MQIGNRQPEAVSRRRRRAFNPGLLALEARVVMAIDLANIAGSLVDPTAPGPFGVLQSGVDQLGGAGFSVAEIGDVNGDGFMDFVVGAPSLNQNLGQPTIGNGSGTAFLIFGSDEVGPETFDWRLLTNQQRTGDLNALGNTNQTNPINGQPSFDYNGLRFIASLNPNGLLGSSVVGVGDVNGDGIADFMIGAPGATDADGLNPNSGRAYLIYGSPVLSARSNKLVDLDNIVGGSADLNILTFTNVGQVNSRTGFSMAGIGDFLVDGTNDIAIGAPNATVSGLASQGAVYVINGSVLRPARTGVVPLNLVGQIGGLSGVVFAGNLSGDAAGFSVAGVGNTTGRTTASQQSINDLLIGAPDVNVTGAIVGTGSAHLVNGATLADFTSVSTIVNDFRFINLGRIGVDVPGVTFLGQSLGDRTGWAVSAAGDFNGDGIADYLIGSPGFSGLGGPESGLVTMVFGRPVLPNPPGAVLGVFPINDLLPGVASVQFNGPSPSALAGFSIAPVGQINNDTLNEIIIGAPGVNGGQGQVYLIPGNPELFGTQSLAATEQLPLQGLIISLSQPAGANFLGASVSGRLGLTGAGRTADADRIGDFIIGAPAFALPGTTRNLAGGAFILEGAFVPLPDIVSTAIPLGIAGVDASFIAPFQVNATTPSTMDIFVLSDATINPNFIPARDLDPTTVEVNGVLFPNATIVADTVDRNMDGLPDAIITISPRSALNLQRTTTTLTVEARTLSTSPLPNQLVVGAAPIQVVGGGGGGGGLPAQRVTQLFLLDSPNLAAPRFGERLLPNATSIGRFNWRPPLGANAAFRQFMPRPGFAARLGGFFHNPDFGDPIGSRFEDSQGGISTLGRKVFTRGQFPVGFFDARAFRPRRGF